MKNLLLFILSLAIHLIIGYLLLTLDFQIDNRVEEEPLSIKIIKKQDNVQGKRELLKSDVDIIESKTDDINIEKPQKPNITQEIREFEPEIKKELVGFNNLVKVQDDFFNNQSFEESLEELIPEVELFNESEGDVDFIWEEGEERSLTSTIDFTSFPRESFTGVGVSVKFMVSSRGDVYDVEIVPPGSGSPDFDILIIQYIKKLKFSSDEKISRGEVNIVYEE